MYIQVWAQFFVCGYKERENHALQIKFQFIHICNTFCGACPFFRSIQNRATFTANPSMATMKNFICKCVAMIFSRNSNLAFSTAAISNTFIRAFLYFRLFFDPRVPNHYCIAHKRNSFRQVIFSSNYGINSCIANNNKNHCVEKKIKNKLSPNSGRS